MSLRFRINIGEGIDIAKSNNSKRFATIGFLIIGLNFKILFVMVVTI